MRNALSITVLCSLFLLVAFGRSSEHIQKESGKVLFNKYCVTCHRVNTSTPAGPPFQRVRQIHGKEWVYQFMRNPATLLEKDSISVRMLRKFNGQIMPSYPMLTKAQVEAICDYVDSFPYNSNSKDYDHRKQ